MGYVKGFNEGKREGLVVGKSSQRVFNGTRYEGKADWVTKQESKVDAR